LTGRVSAFLRQQLAGGWAYTTKDTAAAVYALSEALPANATEMHPNETVQVSVDGRTVRDVRITHPVLDASDAEVVLPAGDVHDGSIVRIDRSGTGSLYWSADFLRYLPAQATASVDKETSLLERLFPSRPEVNIVRKYTPERDGPWRVGERVAVEITITSRRDLQYVAIEDPFPAGTEHGIEQGSAADDWSRLSFLDDRASFFAERLKGGEPLVLRYALVATTAGTYIAPPTTLSSMYGPPGKALGRAQNIVILPQ
jgi:uncharacterized protein YfaS (alpha-2-macroglobulin family)